MKLADLDEYAFDYLDVMSDTVNYNQWIYHEVEDFLGKNIIEVGSGIGVFAELLLSSDPDNLYSIEPSKELYKGLEERKKRLQNQSTHFNTINGYLADFKKSAEQDIDSIVYVNVLEHIEKDDEELSLAYDIIKTSGHICIYVPALQWLYGTHDKHAGHYRRYYLKDLVRKMEEAGFDIISAKYFDIFGVLPWWINFCLLKKNNLNKSQAKIYDRWIVPFMRILEGRLTPFIGKNLIVIGRKP